MGELLDFDSNLNKTKNDEQWDFSAVEFKQGLREFSSTSRLLEGEFKRIEEALASIEETNRAQSEQSER